MATTLNQYPLTILNVDVIDCCEVFYKISREISESQQSQSPFSIHREELKRWERALDFADGMIAGIVSRTGGRFDAPANTPVEIATIGEAEAAVLTPNPVLNRFVRLFNQLRVAMYKSQSALQGRDFHPADVVRWREDYIAEGYRLIVEALPLADDPLDFPETPAYAGPSNLPADPSNQPTGTGPTPSLPNIKPAELTNAG